MTGDSGLLERRIGLLAWHAYSAGGRARRALLGRVPLAVGDLILTEVLQGCATEKELNEVRRLLLSLTVVPIGGQEVAIEAARNPAGADEPRRYGASR